MENNKPVVRAGVSVFLFDDSKVEIKFGTVVKYGIPRSPKGDSLWRPNARPGQSVL